MVNNFFRFRRLGLLAALTLVLVGYTGANSEVAKYKIESTDSLLGSYLAGRFANKNRDVGVAIEYFSRALEKDPASKVLIEQAFMLDLKAGKWDDAIRHAKQLIAREPNHYTARLFLGISAFKNKKYKDARKHFAKSGKVSFISLSTELTLAWTDVAQKKYAKAIKSLENNRGPVGIKSYRRYHRALISELAKKYDIAAREYAELAKTNQGLRIRHAHARYEANRGRFDKAINALGVGAVRAGLHAITEDLYDKFKAKRKPGLSVTNVDEGLAEAFYGLGVSFSYDRRYDISMVYLQIALYLNPVFDDGYNSLADVYRRMQKHELAISTYDKISKGSPLRHQAQIMKAFSLNDLKKVDRATKLLEQLSNEQPEQLYPLEALGNILLYHKRYKEAITYYNKVIDRIKKPTRTHWRYYYSRGMGYERTNQWPKAEKDLQMALKLNPNEPDVMNYLGYSWVDQNKNLKEAMGLIRKAVRLRPNSGEFVDSLGWAHYRLGKYDEAVKELEKAVVLKPDDPVINDHLGDAYWQVGRRFESEYQWSLSLSLKPDEKTRKELERKLKEGLIGGPKTNAAQLENGKKPSSTVKK